MTLEESNSKGRFQVGISEGFGFMGFTGHLLAFSRISMESSAFGISPGCSPRQEKPRNIPKVWNLSRDLSMDWEQGTHGIFAPSLFNSQLKAAFSFLGWDYPWDPNIPCDTKSWPSFAPPAASLKAANSQFPVPFPAPWNCSQGRSGWFHSCDSFPGYFILD